MVLDTVCFCYCVMRFGKIIKVIIYEWTQARSFSWYPPLFSIRSAKCWLSVKQVRFEHSKLGRQGLASGYCAISVFLAKATSDLLRDGLRSGTVGLSWDRQMKWSLSTSNLVLLCYYIIGIFIWRKKEKRARASLSLSWLEIQALASLTSYPVSLKMSSTFRAKPQSE